MAGTKIQLIPKRKLIAQGLTSAMAQHLISNSQAKGVATDGYIHLEDTTGDLDDITDGTTYSKVLTTDISAGHVKLSECTGSLDDVDNGSTYGRVAVTDITSGHIKLSTCSGNLDNISDGTSYGKVALTSISSGKIVVAGLDANVTARMFTDSTTKTNMEAWKHASDATMIDGGDIYTGSVTANKITVGPGNFLDDPSFERSYAAGGWVGWENTFGTWGRYQGIASRGGDASKCCIYCNTATGDTKLESSYVPAVYGDVCQGLAWVINGSPSPDTGIKVSINWFKADKTYISTSEGSVQAPTATWAQATVTASAPAAAGYCRFMIHSPAHTGDWVVDDCCFYKASQIIVHGTPGGTRIEINGDYIAGYSDATTKQFYLSASDGKAYAGGGNVVISSAGINIYGKDSAFTTRATVDGTIQCKVDANGAIVAGGGNVQLGSDGILVKGTTLIRLAHTDGAIKGYVGANSTGVYISAVYSGVNKPMGFLASLYEFTGGGIADFTAGGIKPYRFSATGAPSAVSGELALWRDSDDHKVYVIYNDPDEGQKKVELT
jgi:hypothetical protein